MKRFDVCRVTGPAVAGAKRLVVVLQHDRLDELDTLVVAPLFPIRQLPVITRLRPTVRIDGAEYVIAIDRMSVLSRQQVSAPIGSLAELVFEIPSAIDFLFNGF